MTAPPVVLRARARQDVETAVAHYRDNAGAAAAIGFVDRLEEAFGHIAGNPRSVSMCGGGCCVGQRSEVG
jgi:toxin ParE1/3/4